MMFPGMSEVTAFSSEGKFEILGSDMQVRPDFAWRPNCSCCMLHARTQSHAELANAPNTQVLNVSVDAGESISAEPGTMAYMEQAIVNTVNCDSCFPRCCSGSSPIMGVFTNQGAEKQVIGLTPNFPAKVVPLNLVGPKGPVVYYCKSGAFFANTSYASLARPSSSSWR